MDLLDAVQTISGQKTFGSRLTVTDALGVSAPRLGLNTNVELSSTTAENYGGVYASSHVFVNGDLHAVNLYGNGAGLTGIGKDNLGNHVATTTLNMNTFDIVGVSTITVSSITTIAEGVTFSTNVMVTGNLGIGLAGSASRFEVKGLDTQAYSLAVGTGTAHQVVVSTSGAVGIGTETPQARMEVSGPEGSGAYIMIFNSGTKMTAWLRNK